MPSSWPRTRATCPRRTSPTVGPLHSESPHVKAAPTIVPSGTAARPSDMSVTVALHCPAAPHRANPARASQLLIAAHYPQPKNTPPNRRTYGLHGNPPQEIFEARRVRRRQAAGCQRTSIFCVSVANYAPARRWPRACRYRSRSIHGGLLRSRSPGFGPAAGTHMPARRPTSDCAGRRMDPARKPRGMTGSVRFTAGFVMFFVSAGIPTAKDGKLTNPALRAKSAAA